MSRCTCRLLEFYRYLRTCLDLCDANGVCNAPFVKVGETVVPHATPATVVAAIADALGEPIPPEALS